jgi:hypothetical protein
MTFFYFLWVLVIAGIVGMVTHPLLGLLVILLGGLAVAKLSDIARKTYEQASPEEQERIRRDTAAFFDSM